MVVEGGRQWWERPATATTGKDDGDDEEKAGRTKADGGERGRQWWERLAAVREGKHLEQASLLILHN